MPEMTAAQEALARKAFRLDVTIVPGTDGALARRWTFDGTPVDLSGVQGYAQVRSHPGASGPPALTFDVAVEPGEETGWVRWSFTHQQSRGLPLLPPQDTTPVRLRGNWWWDCILVWPNGGPRLRFVHGRAIVVGAVTVVSG